VTARTFTSEGTCNTNQQNFLYEVTVPLGPACTPGKDQNDQDVAYTVNSLIGDASTCSTVRDGAKQDKQTRMA